MNYGGILKKIKLDGVSVKLSMDLLKFNILIYRRPKYKLSTQKLQVINDINITEQDDINTILGIFDSDDLLIQLSKGAVIISNEHVRLLSEEFPEMFI